MRNFRQEIDDETKRVAGKIISILNMRQINDAMEVTFSIGTRCYTYKQGSLSRNFDGRFKDIVEWDIELELAFLDDAPRIRRMIGDPQIDE